MKFLILGTGADINKIDFCKIDKSFKTAGVNRIYDKFIPDYYFIYDADRILKFVPDKIKVVYTHPDQLQLALSKNPNHIHNFCTYYDPDYTPAYELNGKEYDCGHGSINYLLRMLNNYLFPNQDNIFYIVGVPLLEEIGHFWGDTEETLSIQPVLDRFFNDFLRLKRSGYNIISLMEKSRLNEIFPIEKLEIIYA